MVLVASGVAVLAVSVGRLATVEHHAIEVGRRAEPARNALEAMNNGLGKTQYEFADILVEPDPAARIIALEETRRQLSQNEQDWRRFQELSLHLPGEAELARRYEELNARQNQLAGPVGLGLIAGMLENRDPGELFRDPSFVELRSTQREVQLVIQELQRLYDDRVGQEVTLTADSAENGKQTVLILYGSVMVVSAIIAFAAFRSARDKEREAAADASRRAREARRNELEARLYRALEMASSEEAAFKIVRQALAEALPDQPAELLVADSSASHFRQVLSTDTVNRGPGCAVVSPSDCPAALRGNTLVFASSSDLDACPYLRERQTGPCAAVCQPVSIAGKTLGVVHTTFEAGLPSDGEILVDLELIARRSGERIGMLRAFAQTQLEAKTDPLTGLMNRRSLENAVRRLVQDGTSYVVAYADFDHFKRLNDTYGHDTGDRALRVFAKALRDNIRPNDYACRYGGEEFVLVLPDCALDEAVPVLERVRSSLADVLTSGRVPSFTVSFGVASSTQADSFERVVSLADSALLQAKAAGRDRVVISPGLTPALPPVVAGNELSPPTS